MEQVLFGAVGALSAAVVFLFQLQMSSNRRFEARLTDQAARCEREKDFIIALIMGCPAAMCPVRSTASHPRASTSAHEGKPLP